MTSTPIQRPARELIDELGLMPHPEGGWYREVYRSTDRVQRGGEARSVTTAIYYLLEQQQLSRWHVVDADEIWHFYAGAPLELLSYDPTSRQLVRHILDAPGHGTTSLGAIPAGVWQAARSLGPYSLVGCTVSPAFEFSGFQFVDALPGHQAHFVGAMAQFAVLL